jgi:hypothetical protein
MSVLEINQHSKSNFPSFVENTNGGKLGIIGIFSLLAELEMILPLTFDKQSEGGCSLSVQPKQHESDQIYCYTVSLACHQREIPHLYQ